MAEPGPIPMMLDGEPGSAKMKTLMQSFLKQALLEAEMPKKF